MVSWGYPKGEVCRDINKVRKMDWAKLLEGRRVRQKEGVPPVVTSSSHLPNINRILVNKRHILKRSRNLDKFSEAKSFVAYRRGTNLVDIPVKKKTKKILCQGQKNNG